MGLDPRDISRHRFVRTLARSLRQRCRVGRGETVLLAVSGGIDSVALLRAVHALAGKRGWDLTVHVGHVQHHLRPEADAEADARFVEALAGEVGVPFHRRDITVDADAGNVEACARRLRYEALAEMAARCQAAVAAVGHHADDQLETVLMRLLRGASVRGLAGMAWRRRLSRSGDCRLIRPMLAVTRDEAEGFLRDIGQAWREDRTNRDTARWRAKLRAQVLPVLRELRPDGAHKAVAMGEHLREVQQLIDGEAGRCASWVTEVEGEAGALASLPRDRVRSLNPAVQMALWRRLLMRAGVGGDALRRPVLRPLIEAVGDRRGGLRRLDLPGGLIAEVTRETVTLRRRPARG